MRASHLVRFLPILIAAACRHETPAAESARKPVSIHTVAVEETSAGARRASGVTAALQTAEIAARSPASVIRVSVREGEHVRRGRLLVELDSRELQARLEAAQSSERAASAEARRMARLAATQAATVRETEAADAAAAGARAAVEEARAAMTYLRPTAPFDGRIASVPVHPGDDVGPGQKLVILESLSGFETQASIDADAASGLEPGAQVVVRVDGIPDPLVARVRSVSPAGNPDTHRFLLRAELPPDQRLRSGIFAVVELPAAGETKRLTVPTAALVERGGLTGVFVVENGTASLRWISIGAREGDRIVVRAGLAPGDRVALETAGLTDGMPFVELP
jgi:RND family efflux transporter MFP subunit